MPDPVAIPTLPPAQGPRTSLLPPVVGTRRGLRAYVPHYPVLFAIGGSALTGLIPIFVRLADVGATASAAHRFLLALPLLWLWMRWEKDPAAAALDRQRLLRNLGGVFALGFLFALTLHLLHEAVHATTVVNAFLFGNLSCVVVPILSWSLLARRPTARFATAVAIALVGVFAVGSPSPEEIALPTTLGDGLAFASAVTWSCYVMALKQLRRELDAPTLLFWSAVVAAPFLFGLSALRGEPLLPGSLGAIVPLLGLGIVVHVFGHGLLAYSMSRISANAATVVLFVAPATAASFAWLFFGEALAGLQIAGGVLILVGMAAAKDDERAVSARVRASLSPAARASVSPVGRA